MTVNEHIEQLRRAPKGTMLQLEGGAPPSSASRPAQCIAESVVAAKAATTAHHVPTDCYQTSGASSGEVGGDGADGGQHCSHESGDGQTPAVPLHHCAAGLAPQPVSSSGDSFKTAPSQVSSPSRADDPQPQPPSPAVLPEVPEQWGGRRTRQREAQPNYEDYIDSSLSQLPESDDDGLDFGTSRRKKRTGSGRGSARRSSGDAKRGSGTKSASAKQRQESARSEAADPNHSPADAHAALDGGDDSAHEGDDRTLRKSDRAARRGSAGSRKRPRSKESAGQQRQKGMRSSKRARTPAPQTMGAEAATAAAVEGAADEVVAAEADASGGAAAEAAPIGPGSSTGTGVTAQPAGFDDAEPEPAPEPDAVSDQGPVQVAAGTPAADTQVITDAQLAAKAAAKAARRAQRKAHKKSAREAAKQATQPVAVTASKASKQGKKQCKRPANSSGTASQQPHKSQERLSAAPQRDTGFATPGGEPQLKQVADKGPSQCSSGSGASQTPLQSSLLAALGKHISPARSHIPACVLMQAGQNRPVSILRKFDSPAAAPGSGKAAGSRQVASGAKACSSPLIDSAPAALAKHSNGSRKQSSGQRGSLPKQRPGSSYKLAGLSRMPIKPLHPQLHKRASR